MTKLKRRVVELVSVTPMTREELVRILSGVDRWAVISRCRELEQEGSIAGRTYRGGIEYTATDHGRRKYRGTPDGET